MIPNRSAPSAPVVPIVVYRDVTRAIEWLTAAFGFREHLRAIDRNGVVGHAQLRTDQGGDIMIGRAGGPFEAPQPGQVHQYVCVAVADVDAHFARTQAFGAQIIEAPQNMPFGVRHYTAADLDGHWWLFSQNIADIEPSAWGAVVQPEP